jgi:hypothetical protein
MNNQLQCSPAAGARQFHDNVLTESLEELIQRAKSILLQVLTEELEALTAADRLIEAGKLIKVRGDWYLSKGVGSHDLGRALTGRLRYNKAGQLLLQLRNRSECERLLRTLERLLSADKKSSRRGSGRE